MWHRTKGVSLMQIGTARLQPKTNRNVNKIIIFTIPTVVLRNPHLHKTCVTSHVKGSFQKTSAPNFDPLITTRLDVELAQHCFGAFQPSESYCEFQPAMRRIYFHHLENHANIDLYFVFCQSFI